MDRRKGSEPKKRGIPNRNLHSRNKDVRKMGLHSQYHLVEIHHGNEEPKILHDLYLARNHKGKNDGIALQGEIIKLKPSAFNGEKYREIEDI